MDQIFAAGWEGAEAVSNGNGSAAPHEPDSGGFDEVSLSSPPDKPPARAMPPNLAAVAKTLMGHGAAAGNGSSADAARQLSAENTRLKQRLAAVEDVSTHGCRKCACWLCCQTCAQILGSPGNSCEGLGCRWVPQDMQTPGAHELWHWPS